jgi:hypothetical protein
MRWISLFITAFLLSISHAQVTRPPAATYPDMSEAIGPVSLFTATQNPLPPGDSNLVTNDFDNDQHYIINDCTGMIKNPIIIDVGANPTLGNNIYFDTRACSLSEAAPAPKPFMSINNPLQNLGLIGGAFQIDELIDDAVENLAIYDSFVSGESVFSKATESITFVDTYVY